MRNKYTFATVVFEDDYPLLLLQARSMHKYCPLDIVDAIIVIDNSERALSPRWKKRLLVAYGHLAKFVKFIGAREIAEMPPSSSALGLGWWSQQVLKLMVSRIIHSSRYVILDAKSHLVYALKRNFLETPDGRACILIHPYEIDHPLRPDLERVFSYLGVDHTLYVHNFTPSTPPFIMYTNIVRELVDHFATREGVPFEHLFIQNKLLEFFLYTGYIIMRGINLDNLYFFHRVDSPIVFIGDAADENGCARAVATATAQQSPFFGIHRRAILRLNARSRRTIANFWCNRELFASNNAANRFLVIFRIRLLSNILRRRVSSLPRRVSGLILNSGLRPR